MDRSDELSGLSAAPFENLPAEKTAPRAEAREADYGRLPPRPLPPRAFCETAVSAADTPAVAPPRPSEPLSADLALSEIDAEARLRSRSAIAQPGEALPEAAPPPPVTDRHRLSLPEPAPAGQPSFGQMVPQRMLEPRLEFSAPPPAFDIPHLDGSIEPALSSPSAAPTRNPARRGQSIVARGLRLLAIIAIGWLALVLTLIVAYRFINPPASMLMLQHWVTGQAVVHEWVPFEAISPNVVRAVVLSEDGKFCQHFGIDFEAIEDAMENTDGKVRGGSTISMQVVKNLFLWPSKSYVRKAIELPLTYAMELVWSKRRIMEVYLNIAEWGPGIFGVGAAAEYHFHKSARSLTVRDAARLAAALPNPLARNAGRPGPGLQRLANAVQVRMRLAPSSQLACVLPPRRF